MKDISIVIAESHYLIREGLCAMIAGEQDMQVVAEAKNETELLKILSQQAADVLIMDYKQEPHFNLETISKVKNAFPEINILVISADNQKNSIYQVLDNGVRNFLTKECEKQEILDAIRNTANKEKFFCSKILDYIVEKSFPTQIEKCAPMPLSKREIEIVNLIAQGLIAKEIAAKLHLSTHTIYTHRKNIMKKLGIKSTSELILFAVDTGILWEKA